MLLITGSEGRIARVIGPLLAERYDIRTADRVESTWNASNHIRGCLTDTDLAAKACRGVDTVIHLAHAPVEPDGDYMTERDPNLPMLFTLLDAARREGCRRFICASSVHAVAGYPNYVLVEESMAPRPDCRYGVLKGAIESACAHADATDNMSVFAVRIGVFHAPGQKPTGEPLTRRAYLNWRDMLQITRLMINARSSPALRVFHAASHVRSPLFSLRMTEDTLGYHPTVSLRGR